MVPSCCFSLPASHYPELDLGYHGSSTSPFRVWLPHLQETMQVVRETSLASHLEVPATKMDKDEVALALGLEPPAWRSR